MNKALLLDHTTIINNNANTNEIVPFLIRYFNTIDNIYDYKNLKLCVPNVENLLLLVKKSDIEYDVVKTIKKCDSILNLYQYYMSYTKEHNIMLLDVKLKNDEDNGNIHRISSGANLTLSVVHCISEIDFNLDDHIVIDENNKIFLRDMWMIFDRNGKYLSIYKSLDGARQYVINLNKDIIDIYYPEISQEDKQLIVVSLSYNKNDIVNYAMRVKINTSKGLSIKSQIVHWQGVNAEFIHKYIAP